MDDGTPPRFKWVNRPTLVAPVQMDTTVVHHVAEVQDTLIVMDDFPMNSEDPQYGILLVDNTVEVTTELDSSYVEPTLGHAQDCLSEHPQLIQEQDFPHELETESRSKEAGLPYTPVQVVSDVEIIFEAPQLQNSTTTTSSNVTPTSIKHEDIDDFVTNTTQMLHKKQKLVRPESLDQVLKAQETARKYLQKLAPLRKPLTRQKTAHVRHRTSTSANETSLKCILCNVVFLSYEDLKSHVADTHKQFCCVCSISFSSLLFHQKHEDLLSDQEKCFCCPRCGQKVYNIHEWILHIDSHKLQIQSGTKEEKCPFCIKMLPRSDMKEHFSTHLVKDCANCLNFYLVDATCKKMPTQCLCCHRLSKQYKVFAFACNDCKHYRTTRLDLLSKHMKLVHRKSSQYLNFLKAVDLKSYKKETSPAVNSHLIVILSSHRIRSDVIDSRLCDCLFIKCEEQFIDYSSLRRHVIEKHRLCRFCQVVFNSDESLLAHQKQHQQEKIIKFEVSEDSTVFFNRRSTCKDYISKENLNSMIVEKPQLSSGNYTNSKFACPFCDLICKNSGALHEHTKDHPLITEICLKCNKMFVSARPYSDICSLCEQHNIITKSYDTDPLEFHCSICDLRLISFPFIKEHVSLHLSELKFKCTTCIQDDESWTLGTLSYHISNCYRGRNFHVQFIELLLKVNILISPSNSDFRHNCVLCEDTFSRLDALQVHLEKGHPTYCNICCIEFYGGKCTSHYNDLIKESTTKSPSFMKCPYCPVQCPPESFLSHVNEHTQIQPNGCMDIVVTEKSNSTLPFQCSVCVKEKRAIIFSCMICHRKFQKLEKVIQHVNTTHSIVFKLCDCDPNSNYETMELRTFILHLEQTHSESKKHLFQKLTSACISIDMSSIPLACYCPHCKIKVTYLTEHINNIHFPCRSCTLLFSNKSEHDKHLEEHLQGNIAEFSCKICPAKFNSLIDCQAHVNLHDNVDSFTKFKSEIVFEVMDKALTPQDCPICFRSFGTGFVAQQHAHYHKPASCRKCYRTFSTLHNPQDTDLCSVCEQASMSILKRTYSCSKCRFVLDTFELLTEHFKSCHLDCISCDYCSEQFLNLKTLNEHLLQSHNKSTYFLIQTLKRQHLLEDVSQVPIYPCLFCKSSFDSCHLLRGHVTDKHDYCKACFILFNNSIDLKDHLQDHTKNKIIVGQCSNCEVTFKQKSCWLKHIRMSHGHHSFRLNTTPVPVTVDDPLDTSCPLCANEGTALHVMQHKTVKCNSCSKQIVYLAGVGSKLEVCVCCDSLSGGGGVVGKLKRTQNVSEIVSGVGPPKVPSLE